MACACKSWDCAKSLARHGCTPTGAQRPGRAGPWTSASQASAGTCGPLGALLPRSSSIRYGLPSCSPPLPVRCRGALSKGGAFPRPRACLCTSHKPCALRAPGRQGRALRGARPAAHLSDPLHPQPSPALAGRAVTGGPVALVWCARPRADAPRHTRRRTPWSAPTAAPTAAAPRRLPARAGWRGRALLQRQPGLWHARVDVPGRHGARVPGRAAAGAVVAARRARALHALQGRV